MAERLETTALPARRLLTGAGIGFLAVLVLMGAVYGLYRAWTNGPQTRLRPAPLANAAAPPLRTDLFRPKIEPKRPDPAEARAQGYRWRDPAHSRVSIPIDRAMDLVAARGAQGFDPPAEARP